MPDAPDRLATVFAELHAAVSSRTRLPGLAAARATAHRRRTVRLAAGTAAVVAVLLISAGIAVGALRNGAPPPPSATTSPPSAQPTSSVGPAPAGPPLADQVPAWPVRNATLDVPAFPLAGCPSGSRMFQNRYWENDTIAHIEMLRGATGDVNGDGEGDVLLVLRCDVFGSAPASGGAAAQVGGAAEQVVAYASGGAAPRLLGQVWAGQGDVTRLVVADGAVQLDVAPADPTAAGPIAQESYRWTGSAFAQAGHSEIPHADVPNIEVSIDPSSLALPRSSSPYPALSTPVQLTIRNDGDTSIRPLELTIVSTVGLIVYDPATGPLNALDEPSQNGDSYTHTWILAVAAPDPGQSTTITLDLALVPAITVPENSRVSFTLEGNANTRGPGTSGVTAEISLQ